ncbi:ABC transporter ATP-binding protein [Planctomicrobium piriforme]|uniref:Phospholipid/cholesterol/gamma-HCH transport system ATP-binding protein n=1 Tax=Planctomicrobium piriforme TaxID=1576369 RepID=A0A1I3MUI9_9PLAN|nr:ATP-binding cassette domain-containing protein [Planctomicrobium piriforme]SFJ00450.1 phospholipid/cholesterol/gamma-HCH transport system ATP-binding protein [Planctomicrobium piriforme]
MSAILNLSGVYKQFGSQPILRDIDLSIEAEKTLVIIGESGCGKSVTLKLLMNLITPTEGQVRWWGQPVKKMNEREQTRQRLRFGYLFQMAALFDSLTIYENVAFSLRQNTRLSDSDIDSIVHERLRDVGLDSRIVGQKKPAELSGGMRKRVGLARALATDPDVMLYDEPTTGLDPIMSDVINELIISTRERRHMTSIVVTHDMHTVQKVADRVVMFYPLSRLEHHEPQIIFDGTPEQAFETDDSRVSQFVRGEAGDRMLELAAA